MSERPLVSVLLCNYNYAPYLPQAIESVLEQSYDLLELVVVDDGSSDDSRRVIESYGDERMRAVFQENAGQPAAFNAAFEKSSGDLVALLDSDDWWKPDKLEAVVAWHALSDENYGLLQHQLDVWEDGRTRPYRAVLPSGDVLSEMQRTGNIYQFVPTSGLVFRRAVLEELMPMPTHFRISADAWLMRAAVALGPVISIPRALGYYRRHAGSATQGDDVDLVDVVAREVIPALNEFYAARGIALHLDERLGRRWLPARLQSWLRRARRLVRRSRRRR